MSDLECLPRPAADPDRVAVARFLASTSAEGPGERTAVWVQGCSIRCPGCFNPHLWTIRGGRPTPVPDLARRIVSAATTGLTFLGGGPFDQAASLARVAATVQKAGLSVMTFTGYQYEQLTGLAHDRSDVADLL